MRALAVIALVLESTVALGQSSERLLDRWRTDQNEAAVTLVRMRMEEDATYDTEGAFGPRQMEIGSTVVIDRSTPHADRDLRYVRMGKRELDAEDLQKHRRFQSPIRRDLMRAADQLLFPERLLPSQEPLGDPDSERLDGRDIVRVQTVARNDEGPVERITWFFERTSGRLLQTRSVVRGDERGTMVVTVLYDRIEGLDLPVGRELEGSFSLRRRTRTYTVLATAQATYVLVSLESL